MKKTHIFIYVLIAVSVSALFYFRSTDASIMSKSDDIKIRCGDPQSRPSELMLKGEEDTVLKIIFQGLLKNGSNEIITLEDGATITDEDLNSLSEIEKNELSTNLKVHDEITCLGSGKKSNLTRSGMSVTCPKGDGLQILMMQPTDPNMYGAFTLVSTTLGKCYPGGWCVK